jgi:23S rRNA-/tRNA-specific pseudouridylate synthase
MGKQFQHKTIRKRYKAIVLGKLNKESGTIDTKIEGKESLTEYEVVKSTPSAKYGFLSLVDLYPVTGRTHQLRIHMAELGHPVIGDKYYTQKQEVLAGKGLMLCSDHVWFTHPITQEKMDIGIRIPNKFEKYMEREAFRAKNHDRKKR